MGIYSWKYHRIKTKPIQWVDLFIGSQPNLPFMLHTHEQFGWFPIQAFHLQVSTTNSVLSKSFFFHEGFKQHSVSGWLLMMRTLNWISAKPLMIILWCVARFSFKSEISMFSSHLDLVQKIQEKTDLVWKIPTVGHMIVLNQEQCHLPIVKSHSCLDNVTYPLWQDDGCSLWCHGAVIWNVWLVVIRLLLPFTIKRYSVHIVLTPLSCVIDVGLKTLSK